MTNHKKKGDKKPAAKAAPKRAAKSAQNTPASTPQNKRRCVDSPAAKKKAAKAK